MSTTTIVPGRLQIAYAGFGLPKKFTINLGFATITFQLRRPTVGTVGARGQSEATVREQRTKVRIGQ